MQPFPPTGFRCQVSADGGWQPAWGRRPDRLYFLSPGGNLMVVTLNLRRKDACPVAPPRIAFQTPVRDPSGSRSHYDVSHSDGRFVFSVPARENLPTVVINWPRTLTAMP
jgi:hypothetical protein